MPSFEDRSHSARPQSVENVVIANANLYVENLDGGVNIVYNDFFNKYFLVDPVTLSLNNYSVYAYNYPIIFVPGTGYVMNAFIKRANNSCPKLV